MRVQIIRLCTTALAELHLNCLDGSTSIKKAVKLWAQLDVHQGGDLKDGPPGIRGKATDWISQLSPSAESAELRRKLRGSQAIELTYVARK